MSRELARFTRARLADELARVTGVIPFADPAAPTSDERSSAAEHLQAQFRIVRDYEEVASFDDEDDPYEFAVGRAVGLGKAVRRIADVYRDHPDYRQEWAP